ncbi:hypothetical protein [Pandoraea sp.]|uniref:hypothetical protein n=1 Tax=Pandoraea sp. TaxID=1883445 RepID=UPI0011F8A541|nr:hypothetical protein [Pandoraea sp.]TAL55888.1 MAG: hypothetical protein EPN80_05840 [Pandoraea sp.]TAM17115.1 MAG: hypothetical protein EPN65_12640 [Pandoraea sp.]
MAFAQSWGTPSGAAAADRHRQGSVAACYPETNVLVPLDYFDKESGTPSYKSGPVRVTRSA